MTGGCSGKSGGWLRTLLSAVSALGDRSGGWLDRSGSSVDSGS